MMAMEPNGHFPRYSRHTSLQTSVSSRAGTSLYRYANRDRESLSVTPERATAKIRAREERLERTTTVALHQARRIKQGVGTATFLQVLALDLSGLPIMLAAPRRGLRLKNPVAPRRLYSRFSTDSDPLLLLQLPSQGHPSPHARTASQNTNTAVCCLPRIARSCVVAAVVFQPINNNKATEIPTKGARAGQQR